MHCCKHIKQVLWFCLLHVKKAKAKCFALWVTLLPADLMGFIANAKIETLLSSGSDCCSFESLRKLRGEWQHPWGGKEDGMAHLLLSTPGLLLSVSKGWCLCWFQQEMQVHESTRKALVEMDYFWKDWEEEQHLWQRFYFCYTIFILKFILGFDSKSCGSRRPPTVCLLALSLRMVPRPASGRMLLPGATSLSLEEVRWVLLSATLTEEVPL